MYVGQRGDTNSQWTNISRTSAHFGLNYGNRGWSQSEARGGSITRLQIPLLDCRHYISRQKLWRNPELGRRLHLPSGIPKSDVTKFMTYTFRRNLSQSNSEMMFMFFLTVIQCIRHHEREKTWTRSLSCVIQIILASYQESKRFIIVYEI